MSLENEVLELMRSVQVKYFPDLADCVFQVEERLDFDGVAMRVIFGAPARVCLYYSDSRVLETKYRMGLVPVISHELAHLIDPVDPERVLAERLPTSMMQLWEALIDEGLAVCSMASKLEMPI